MSDESPKYPISAAAVLTGFFFCQALGYHNGQNETATLSFEGTVAFGMQHLSHIFSPGNSVIAWPFSPFLAGILLSLTPYLPALIRKGGAAGDGTVRFFVSLLLCLTLNTLLVSITGISDAVENSIGIRNFLGGPLPLSFVYFCSASLFFLIAWRSFPKFYPRLSDRWINKWQHPVSIDYLCILIACWLFYATYTGSQFDGLMDARLELLQK